MFSPLRGIPCFLSIFPSCPGILGFGADKKSLFFGGFPCLFPKNQRMEGQGSLLYAQHAWCTLQRHVADSGVFWSRLHCFTCSRFWSTSPRCGQAKPGGGVASGTQFQDTLSIAGNSPWSHKPVSLNWRLENCKIRRPPDYLAVPKASNLSLELQKFGNCGKWRVQLTLPQKINVQ